MTPVETSQALRMDPALELDQFLAAFEKASAGGETPDLALFLPPRGHPLHDDVLRELVRVDLEFAWSRGNRKQVEEYRARFPDVFGDPSVVRDLAREEYRLRKAAGESPDPKEYRKRFGIVLDSIAGPLQPTRVQDGSQFEWPDDRMPIVGDTIPPGYHLTSELGRGSFGQVFLAREIGLGGRPVAVKISAHLAGEPITLAGLQHTNIVPVYAAHRLGSYTALVMPYVGRTTLADILDSFREGHVPQSGHDLATTLGGRANSTAADPTAMPGDPEPLPAPGKSRAVLDALDRMTFVEAALWIGAELADGLAHAHDRGVLHRDIKPANILFSDDGRPMLLDFNLAALDVWRVCGTPGYMAPEQLVAALKEKGVASEQTDIYALGLLLVELLTGHMPFKVPAGQWEEVLPKMALERQRSPIETTKFPSGVTPGVRAILAKCLDPDPAKRYARTGELRDDLNRQRTNLPLKFAAERSVREKIRKWARRHPRLSSGGTIAAAATFVVVLVTAGFLARQRHLNWLEAESARNGLREARDFAQSGLPSSTSGERQDVLDRAARALVPYKVESDDWVKGALVTSLTEAERDALRRDAAELMFKVAASSAESGGSDGPDQAKRLDAAIEWNRRARVAFPGRPPRPFLAQQVRLLRAAGMIEAAGAAANAAREAPELHHGDPASVGFAALEGGQYREAAEYLQAASRTDAPRYSVWMGLAAAETRLAHYGRAIDALSAAIALRPASPWPHYHRGTARLESNDLMAAIIDFDRFLELRPDDPDGYLNRAVARLLNHDARGAVMDLDRAERLGSTRTRLFALRVQARLQLGDTTGADRDRSTCLNKTPSDPVSWCSRAELRNGSDAAGALADFDAALALDPNHLNALRGKASILSERLNRPSEAIPVLDRILELVPDSVSDRAGRAVLLARLGRTAEARREIETNGRRAETAMVNYQLASAALVAGDRSRGLELLRATLRKDPALGAAMPADPDLKLVWKDAAFLNLIAAAGTLSGK